MNGGRMEEGFRMFKYHQYCPVARACEVIADRWTPLIVRELLFGSRHFNELQRGLPRISRSLLVARLRHLEDNGVIERLTGARPNVTEYTLTARPPLLPNPGRFLRGPCRSRRKSQWLASLASAARWRRQSGRLHTGWRESSSSQVSPSFTCNRLDSAPFSGKINPNDKGISERRQRKTPPRTSDGKTGA